MSRYSESPCTSAAGTLPESRSASRSRLCLGRLAASGCRGSTFLRTSSSSSPAALETLLFPGSRWSGRAVPRFASLQIDPDLLALTLTQPGAASPLAHSHSHGQGMARPGLCCGPDPCVCWGPDPGLLLETHLPWG